MTHTPHTHAHNQGGRSDLSLWMGLDLPDPRRDRIAERRTFVELKQTFMQAAAHIPGRLGNVLAQRLRQSSDLESLLQLRHPLLAGLSPDNPSCETHRTLVEAHLKRIHSLER
ncbi:MAG: hypothetical protein RJA98_2695 [Pseudomonadota bacterium]|jgi:hypothetical protein